MRIVLTRHPQQAGDLESGLLQEGCHIGFMPLTQQVLPADTQKISAAIRDLQRGAFSWLILTSANTIRALVTCGWDGTVPEGTRVGVVGPGTASLLGAVTGLQNAWMPKQHSATGILSEFPAPGPDENSRMLLPQSAQARTLLLTGLRSQGWEPTQVLAYETVPLSPEHTVPSSRMLQPLPSPAMTDDWTVLSPEELNDDDVLLVTSSSAAEQWVARGRRSQTRLLAIGEPTAETLRRLGSPADQVLSAPTAEGVLTCLRG